MSSPWPRHPSISVVSIAAIASRSCRPRSAALRDEVLALDLGEHRAGHGGAEGVAAERGAVRARVEQLARRAERDERADREAAADALRDRDRVGRDAGVLEGEPLTRAAGAGLDLVDDEQRAVALGEFARGREVSLGQVDRRPPRP